MNVFQSLKGAVCVTALMTGTAAVADVTAAQVWEDWQQNLEIYGDEGITIGSVDESGGTVTINDMMLMMDDGYSSVEANIGDIVFTEQGDGTVAVTMSDEYPITIVDGSEPFTITVFNTGLSMVVSGDPGALTYDVSADTYGLRLDAADDVTGEMRLTANGLAGSYGSEDQGDLREIGYDLSAESVDLLVDVKVDGDQGYMLMSGKIDGLETGFGAAVPADMDPDNPEDAFVNGLGFEGGYRFASADYIFDFDLDGDQAAGSLSMGEGSLRGSMEKDYVSYRAGTNAIDLTIQSNEFPFPVNFSAAEYGISFEMPLAKSDEPQEFGASVKLIDLAVNDEIWSMVDPAAQIPRDPATVDVALSGTAKLFFDLLDPEQAEAIARSDIPGELNSLTLDTMTVALAGAMLTGNGGFTFDNSDLETFDGLPRPTGQIDVELTGANALIDTLVGMGLVPEDQAMMGRMMMGMFARSTGDDQLSSTLEINDQGHVLANGQRLQ